jgi:hypothetical protein
MKPGCAESAFQNSAPLSAEGFRERNRAFLKEYHPMAQVSRRSFLAASAAGAATGNSLLDFARAAEVIPGFDRTKPDYDRTKQWKPFSDRKVRVGIVGHGVCQFGLAFDLQSQRTARTITHGPRRSAHAFASTRSLCLSGGRRRDGDLT